MWKQGARDYIIGDKTKREKKPKSAIESMSHLIGPKTPVATYRNKKNTQQFN